MRTRNRNRAARFRWLSLSVRLEPVFFKGNIADSCACFPVHFHDCWKAWVSNFESGNLDFVLNFPRLSQVSNCTRGQPGLACIHIISIWREHGLGETTMMQIERSPILGVLLVVAVAGLCWNGLPEALGTSPSGLLQATEEDSMQNSGLESVKGDLKLLSSRMTSLSEQFGKIRDTQRDLSQDQHSLHNEVSKRKKKKSRAGRFSFFHTPKNVFGS